MTTSPGWNASPDRTGHLIVVSDTHLSPSRPEAGANWDAVLAHVAAAAPDAVIHLGDLSMDGATDESDLAYARDQLSRLPVPWHVIPGNHDVGDNPWPGTPPGNAIDDERRARWLAVVGPDCWSLEAGAWTLLALNAQLAGSGLAAEEAQWSWLGQQLARQPPGRPLALLTHKPLAASAAEMTAAPPWRFWPPAARARLATLLADHPPDLVLSGHVHQHRELRLDDGIEQLWVPTTWAVVPDAAQPVLGTKRCALVHLTLPPAPPARHQLVEPPGLRQNTRS